MTWTKLKMGLVIGTAVLLATGTAVVAEKQIQERRTYPWQVNPLQVRFLDELDPQVMIVPTKFPKDSKWASQPYGRMIGIGKSVQELIALVYGMEFRTILSTKLPGGRFDFIANLPSGSREAMGIELKKQFNIVARHEIREIKVLLLKIDHTNAPGLKLTTASKSDGSSDSDDARQITGKNQQISWLAGLLENRFETPVIDQTGLTENYYDIVLKWDAPDWGPNPEGLRKALLDDLGLKLIPEVQPLDVLVVEKVK